MADELADLVLSGIKRATVGPVAEFAARATNSSAAGARTAGYAGAPRFPAFAQLCSESR
jgi:hypothetical protein